MVVPGVISVFLGFWRTYGPGGSLRIGTVLGWKMEERLRFVVTYRSSVIRCYAYTAWGGGS